MICLVATLVLADPSVTFDQAIALADITQHVLAARRADQAKRDADRGVSGMTLNPQVAIQPGRRFDSAGTRNPDLVAEISQSWNLSGHGRARRDTMRIEEEVLTAQARGAALFERLGAGRAWIERWEATRLHAVAEQEVAVATEIARLMQRSRELGEATMTDLQDAQAYLSETRLADLDAEGRVFESGLSLSRALGRSPAVPTNADGDLPQPELPDLARPDVLVARADTLPDVQRTALAARAMRARSVEEHAMRGFIGQFGVVGMRDSSTGGFVLSGSARFTVPLFDRGERERGDYLAAAARDEGESADAYLMAVNDVRLAIHEVHHTGETLNELENALVPTALEAARLHERLLKAGEATVIAALQSRRIAIMAQRRLEMARAANAWAKVKLWLLLSAMAVQET